MQYKIHFQIIMQYFIFIIIQVIFMQLLFSYDAYNLKCLLPENNFRRFTAIDGVQRKSTVFSFHLKSLERSNVILFHIFLRKIKKVISMEGGPNKNRGSEIFLEEKKQWEVGCSEPTNVLQPSGGHNLQTWQSCP